MSADNPTTTAGIRKINQLYDEGEQAWYDVYEAPGIADPLVTATVPREDQSVGAVIRHLLRCGAQLPPVNERQGIITAAIASEAPIVRRAARNGWRDATTFVTHRSVVSGRDDAEAIMPPTGAYAGSTGHMQDRGDLDGWRALIKVARFSTAMMIALAAIFAAPLLKIALRPNFGLVLFGPSRSGKSTAQLAGASALGYGQEEDLPSLNATVSGLLAVAVAFNDHAIPINEIGTARGGKNNVYEVVRETTYGLMNGQDIIRHPSWAGSDGGATATFQVLPLMSSEHSPDAWAARKGETRDEGETARLIGVPVLFNGSQTIFDLAPKTLTGADLAAWEKQQFQLLREGLPNFRGLAFSTYTEWLARQHKAVEEVVRILVANFEVAVARPTMSPVERDIVAKFGVLYAGGLFAIAAGVLPLDMKRLGAALKRACLAALAEIPNPQAELMADLKVLKGKLNGASVLDTETCTRKQLRLMHNADGFRQIKNEGLECVVRSEVFTRWFRSELRRQRVLEWLDAEGFLNHGRDRTTGRSIEWAQRQVTWPDTSRKRSISVYLPGGFADLERAF
ncbi:hypothetical protein ASF24_11170 [Methylobacterium sp. Leaf86]|uniref:DUF927 domain-containing protein n=1 Tax=Methylobacterium sp. Leaf86 TaxID=1736242 RepID=UPI0006F54D74|nr:DUF927 domain-containing protein [Methylobacterium sp. Leaf86]KQO45715.1 hypothetical protein ASF24_11170 [Methylobacterium sp. Leaf86]